MSDQQDEDQPEPQQDDERVAPPQVQALIRAAAVIVQLSCIALMETDWVRELIRDEIKRDMKEGGNSMPPKLEEFIPGERLPDIIDVYVNKEFLFLASGCRDFLNRSTLQPERPIKFVRQYPGRTVIDKVIDGPDRDCPKKLLTGQLDLRYCDSLGVGHHSRVFLAPLTFPSTTPRPSVRGAVAVKLSNPHDDARKMLLNEAKIYNAFPHDLQGGDVPVVPKFYGCYTPCIEISDWVNNGNGSGNLDKEEWTRETMPKCMIVPILLTEACGRAVHTRSLSDSGRASIGTLLERLHEAKFVQGSMFRRNVLVQPGPLSVPRANRSLDEPSYRIIDFGRGISLGVNIFSLQDLKREAESEQRDACAERLTSSKHKLPTLDISSQSSSSIKRTKQSDNAVAMRRFSEVVADLKDTMRVFRPPPSPAPAPSPLTNAVKRLDESIREVRWLSYENAAKMICIFQMDPSAVDAYMAIENENDMRLWVQQSIGVGDLL